jgi:predicted nucleotidyltransferase
MRLNNYELKSIKNSFISHFDSGKIYLFGSRIDDSQKGGDIDLYIVSDDKNKVKRKISFLAELKNKIGQQKIDVVLSYDSNRAIESEANKKSYLIYETHCRK